MSWTRKTNRPKFTDDILRKVVTMAQAGTQLSEISKEMGIPVKSLQNKLRLQGIPLRGLNK